MKLNELVPQRESNASEARANASCERRLPTCAAALSREPGDQTETCGGYADPTYADDGLIPRFQVFAKQYTEQLEQPGNA